MYGLSTFSISLQGQKCNRRVESFVPNRLKGTKVQSPSWEFCPKSSKRDKTIFAYISRRINRLANKIATHYPLFIKQKTGKVIDTFCGFAVKLT